MKELRNLSTRKGIDNVSTPVNLEEDVSIDFIVLGSVAVDKLGHRIGKGGRIIDNFCIFILNLNLFIRRRFC